VPKLSLQMRSKKIVALEKEAEAFQRLIGKLEHKLSAVHKQFTANNDSANRFSCQADEAEESLGAPIDGQPVVAEDKRRVTLRKIGGLRKKAKTYWKRADALERECEAIVSLVENTQKKEVNRESRAEKLFWRQKYEEDQVERREVGMRRQSFREWRAASQAEYERSNPRW
jgi:hypothetical protein